MEYIIQSCTNNKSCTSVYDLDYQMAQVLLILVPNYKTGIINKQNRWQGFQMALLFLANGAGRFNKFKQIMLHLIIITPTWKIWYKKLVS